MKIDTTKIKTKLAQAWDESPALCLTAGATALTAVAKLLQVNTERKKTHVWRDEVDRRRYNDLRK